VSSIIVITYQTRPDKVEAGHQALAELIQVVKREEKDCIAIQMHRDTSDPTKILLWEEWTTEEAFRGPHMVTPHIKAFQALIPELYVGPPLASYWQQTVAV
jgi:quinol monooxygenase YgiN